MLRIRLHMHVRVCMSGLSVVGFLIEFAALYIGRGMMYKPMHFWFESRVNPGRHLEVGAQHTYRLKVWLPVAPPQPGMSPNSACL